MKDNIKELLDKIFDNDEIVIWSGKPNIKKRIAQIKQSFFRIYQHT